MHHRAAALVRALVVIVAALVLSGCASGAITVLSPAQIPPGATYPTLKIESATDTVTIPADARAHFEKRLNEYLFAANSGFTPGDALIMRYRFIQFDEGDRALRYLIGFGAGKGKMTAEVIFLDTTQKELAKITVEGEISMGFLGGDFDMAISTAARKVADYAIATF
jgi:hypothetical protein